MLARLPLAEAVLTLWRWVADSGSLDQIFDDNRGRVTRRSSPLLDGLPGPRCPPRIRGSGRKSFDEAKARGELEASIRPPTASWGDPDPASTAMLAECPARLREVYPCDPKAQTPLPASLDDYRVITLDGKAIKDVAKRLKPLWGGPAACWVDGPWSPWTCAPVWRWRCAADPDGDPNEVRFVGDLVPECGDWARGSRSGPATPGSDLTQPAHFAEQGDAFLVPISQGPVLHRRGVPAREGTRAEGEIP